MDSFYLNNILIQILSFTYFPFTNSEKNLFHRAIGTSKLCRISEHRVNSKEVDVLSSLYCWKKLFDTLTGTLSI